MGSIPVKTTENVTRSKYRLILRLSDGTVKSLNTGKKRRIVSVIRGIEWKEANLRVSYECEGHANGQNQGIYHSLEEAQLALAAFTEPELLDYLAQAS